MNKTCVTCGSVKDIWVAWCIDCRNLYDAVHKNCSYPNCECNYETCKGKNGPHMVVPKP